MQSNFELSIFKTLHEKGYTIQAGSKFPSAVDIIATKADSLILFEIKNYSPIGASDIFRVKSLERTWREKLGVSKGKTHVYLIGRVAGLSAMEAAKQLQVEIVDNNSFSMIINQFV